MLSVVKDEESERLKVMVAKGASPARAAATLRRNLDSVRNQARKIGTPFPTLHQVRRRLNRAGEKQADPH